MLSYVLHLSLCWGLFALLYHTLLRRETLFGANRSYLLSTALAGLILPLLNQVFPLLNNASEELAVNLPVFTINLEQATQQTTEWVEITILQWVYFAGVLLTTLRLLWGLGRISAMLTGTNREYLDDGSVLVRTEKARLPFSFFQWIFVPLNFGTRDSDREMLAHEQAHARAWHSADVLLMEMLSVVFWFHPLVHWYRRSLRTVHEYQADAAAASHSSRKHYGLLLLQQVQTGLPVAFVNHFFQSPLKKRLLMLTRKHSSAHAQFWRYTLALPLIVALWICARTDEAHAQTTAPSKPALELSEVEKLPEFPGGDRAMVDYLSTNIQYPITAKREGVEGIVAILFVVGRDGRVAQVEAIPPTKNTNAEEGPADYRHEMEVEAVRVVQSMPQWSPAYKNGEPVSCKFTLPIKFKLK